jgi:hypothetical protein
MQLHVSTFQATTVYSLENSSILSVEATTFPVPFNYSAIDVLQVLGLGLQVNSSNQTSNILNVVNQQLANANNGESLSLADPLLRNIVALPLYSANGNIDAQEYEGNLTFPNNMLTTGYFAQAVSRVIIADYSLYMFTLLAVLALLWCACGLGYCWIHGGVVPNGSQYPEIEFASKCVVTPNEMDYVGVDVLLKGLGNGNSRDIERRIKSKRIFVGAPHDVMPSAIVLVTAKNDQVEGLKAGNKYL